MIVTFTSLHCLESLVYNTSYRPFYFFIYCLHPPVPLCWKKPLPKLYLNT
ncbi:hypothetical protein Hanom_Chr07g00641351 [Helianthus anomalus]